MTGAEIDTATSPRPAFAAIAGSLRHVGAILQHLADEIDALAQEDIVSRAVIVTEDARRKLAGMGSPRV